ncbi:hypothetical protein BDV40DRAFT_30762 [Aspergillus tamarii]|uniref:Uncharacterized protein n=1 Tax=Aspergillus tamarii TaxID=41984 RepID=A0A5N6V5V1_ASPTM|nr:hypothetical protein BDV40DRAFT_30762 [Aspergillus tamarii]
MLTKNSTKQTNISRKIGANKQWVRHTYTRLDSISSATAHQSMNCTLALVSSSSCWVRWNFYQYGDWDYEHITGERYSVTSPYGLIISVVFTHWYTSDGSLPYRLSRHS